MSNQTNVNPKRKSKAANTFFTIVTGAICGFVVFLLSLKPVMAVGAALGWYGLHDVTSIDAFQLFEASVFGVAWGFWIFKRPAPLKAMKWQAALYLGFWISMCIIAGLSGVTFDPNYLWHTFLVTASIGCLSGFIMGWISPYVLDWLDQAMPQPTSSSASSASKDVTYEIRG